MLHSHLPGLPVSCRLIDTGAALVGSLYIVMSCHVICQYEGVCLPGGWRWVSRTARVGSSAVEASRHDAAAGVSAQTVWRAAKHKLVAAHVQQRSCGASLHMSGQFRRGLSGDSAECFGSSHEQLCRAAEQPCPPCSGATLAAEVHAISSCVVSLMLCLLRAGSRR